MESTTLSEFQMDIYKFQFGFTGETVDRCICARLLKRQSLTFTLTNMSIHTAELRAK